MGALRASGARITTETQRPQREKIGPRASGPHYGRDARDPKKGCHCEERSDEAIPFRGSTVGRRLLRFARNDGQTVRLCALCASVVKYGVSLYLDGAGRIGDGGIC